MTKNCFILLSVLAGMSAKADLTFSFSHDNTVSYGNDLRWCISVTNSSAATGVVATAFSVDWIQYNGQALGVVFESSETNEVPPFSVTNFECRIPASTYRTHLHGSESFECSACAWNVLDEDEEEFETMRSFVEADSDLSIRVSPVPPPATAGIAVLVVEWTNTTPVTLHAEFSVALDSSLRTADGSWLCKWPEQAIPPNGTSVLQTNVVVCGGPPFSVTAHMTSDSYPRLEKRIEISD